MKYSEELEVIFGSTPPEGDIRTFSRFFKCRTKTITNVDQIRDAIDTARSEILAHMGAYNGGDEGGSGGGFEEVKSHRIYTTAYNPLAGSSYIPLPKELQNSMKGLINPQNKKDEECFRWCHLIKKFKAPNNPGRISQFRNYIDRLNYDGV